MKKEYLTPLAIVVGAIIIAVGIYLGLTADDKKQSQRYKECVEYYTENDPAMSKQQIKIRCHRTTR